MKNELDNWLIDKQWHSDGLRGLQFYVDSLIDPTDPSDIIDYCRYLINTYNISLNDIIKINFPPYFKKLFILEEIILCKDIYNEVIPYDNLCKIDWFVSIGPSGKILSENKNNMRSSLRISYERNNQIKKILK